MKSAAPQLDHVDRVLHRAVAGDDDRDDAGVARERGLDDLRAHQTPGRAEVRHDDVEGKASSALSAASPSAA